MPIGTPAVPPPLTPARPRRQSGKSGVLSDAGGAASVSVPAPAIVLDNAAAVAPHAWQVGGSSAPREDETFSSILENASNCDMLAVLRAIFVDSGKPEGNSRIDGFLWVQLKTEDGALQGPPQRYDRNNHAHQDPNQVHSLLYTKIALSSEVKVLEGYDDSRIAMRRVFQETKAEVIPGISESCPKGNCVMHMSGRTLHRNDVENWVKGLYVCGLQKVKINKLADSFVRTDRSLDPQLQKLLRDAGVPERDLKVNFLRLFSAYCKALEQRNAEGVVTVKGIETIPSWNDLRNQAASDAERKALDELLIRVKTNLAPAAEIRVVSSDAVPTLVP